MTSNKEGYMPKYYIVVICCVCKKKIDEKPTDRADQHMAESHTYCDTCMEAMLEEIERS